jgi:hypothetical protein
VPTYDDDVAPAALVQAVDDAELDVGVLRRCPLERSSCSRWSVSGCFAAVPQQQPRQSRTVVGGGRRLTRPSCLQTERMLLVDAANVVGTRPDGWWRDRPAAAARLVAALQPLDERVVVVLEGKARAGASEGEHGGVDVRHARGDGDDLLAELCAPGVVLVTADRGLQDRARARGADVEGPGWLLDRIAY